MPIISALRIRNEARWIADVIKSVLPVSEEVLVWDDRSDDGTPEICEDLGCTVFRSPFNTLDEKRDKNELLEQVFERVPQSEFTAKGKYFCLCIDGDEILHHEDRESLLKATEGERHVYPLRVLYLWDQPDQIRVDGVYANFCRPSLFRVMNPVFRYKATPWGNGANFHCSNIPQEYLHLAHGGTPPARLIHLGYMNREDRLRKFDWYNTVDPNNVGEDKYRHMVQGDLPEIPSHWRRGIELKHAGPLTLAPL